MGQSSGFAHVGQQRAQSEALGRSLLLAMHGDPLSWLLVGSEATAELLLLLPQCAKGLSSPGRWLELCVFAINRNLS